MLPKSANQLQLHMFKNTLFQYTSSEHPLRILGDTISWGALEKEFSSLYSKRGAPAHPFRRMAGLLMLKYVFNLSDERVVAQWAENLHYQFFCGEAEYAWRPPCAASDLVHFRKRLGEEGSKKLFVLSVSLHKDKIKKAKEVLVDTTVQEKNITFPTDTKLYTKVIAQCAKIAEKNEVKLRQGYRFVVKKLLSVIRFSKPSVRAKEGKKAIRKLKTIAGRQVRDLSRKLEAVGKKSFFSALLATMEKIVTQKKSDKNKIYSLHEPDVNCIAKGKAHKKYEFGSKTSIAMLPKSNVIVSMLNFKDNPHDAKTLSVALEDAKEVANLEFTHAIVDRGYRGAKGLGQTEMVTPCSKTANTPYAKKKHRERCRKRSAVEAIIGHLKSDYRLTRNYLRGTVGDNINATLAGMACNLQLFMREQAEKIKKSSRGAPFFLLLSVLKKIWPFSQEKFVGNGPFCFSISGHLNC